MVYLFNLVWARGNRSYQYGAVLKHHVFSEARVSPGRAGIIHCWVHPESADSHNYAHTLTHCYTESSAISDTHPESDPQRDYHTDSLPESNSRRNCYTDSHTFPHT